MLVVVCFGSGWSIRLRHFESIQFGNEIYLQVSKPMCGDFYLPDFTEHIWYTDYLNYSYCINVSVLGPH